MRPRNATSLILTTVVLLVVGLLIAGTIWIWNSVGSSNEPIVYQLELVSVRSVKPVSVVNAGWEIELIVRNRGNVENRVDRVYVDRIEVEEMGLSQGDILSSKTGLGTSLPDGGLVIAAGKSSSVYVWIGSEKFSPGAQVSFEVQRRNQIELKKYIVLS